MPATPKRKEDASGSEPEDSVEEVSPAPAKKGRGRPSKGGPAKKKSSGGDDGAPAAKRGRGRPPSGKAPKKAYVPTGKPRGRPKGSGKKVPKVASGKGRGRPKKAAEAESSD